MRFTSTILFAAAGIMLPGLSLAQTSPLTVAPNTTGAIVQPQPNTTGNDPDVIIAPGGTGAETITTNSAAGGNSSRPERAVPNGSASGSGNPGGGG